LAAALDFMRNWVYHPLKPRYPDLRTAKLTAPASRSTGCCHPLDFKLEDQRKSEICDNSANTLKNCSSLKYRQTSRYKCTRESRFKEHETAIAQLDRIVPRFGADIHRAAGGCSGHICIVSHKFRRLCVGE
jgi:hypothetical protein